MASQTRPFLTTGAALASAAAIVAATPVIAPSLTAAPSAISQANVTLTTFADVLTVPVDEWVSSFFQGYGGIVGPNNPQPGNPSETGGLEPWASGCNAQCFIAGTSGVAYLALDALINGNGQGWDDNENWPVSAVNYFFEGGTLGAGTEWLLQSSVGAANPLLAVAITIFYTGPQILTVVFDNAIQLLGDAALNVPLVGQYIAGALNAYLGPASLYVPFQGYTAGLSGVLNYAIDVAIGAAPVVPAPSATAALAAAATPARATKADETATAAAEVAAPTAVDAVESATSVAAETAPAEAVATADAAAEESAATAAESTPAVASASDAVADTTATETEPADSSAADSAGSKADSTSKTRKRPLRDAVEKVATSIGSALKGAKSGAETAAKPAEKPAAEAADAAS